MARRADWFGEEPTQAGFDTLAAIRAYQDDSHRWLTTWEIAHELGISIGAAARRLLILYRHKPFLVDRSGTNYWTLTAHGSSWLDRKVGSQRA